MTYWYSLNLFSFPFASSEINCGPWKYFNVDFDYENVVEMFKTKDFCHSKMKRISSALIITYCLFCFYI